MPYDISDFEEEVIKRSYQIPVLVDFWAEWCAPCRMLSPVLERLAERSEGKWTLAKVDTEQLTDVAMAYDIQSIPNVKLISQGTVIGEFVGAMPEKMIVEWLTKNLPGENKNRIEAVSMLVQEGRTADAQHLLEDIIREEPENTEAKVLLAKTYLFESPEKALKLIDGIDDPKVADTTETVKTFTSLFKEGKKPELLPQTGTKAAYLNAVTFVRTQDFDSALRAYIDIIREDRYYNDDGARKACIAIFKYLGDEHPVTMKYRREFSGALY